MSLLVHWQTGPWAQRTAWWLPAIPTYSNVSMIKDSSIFSILSSCDQHQSVWGIRLTGIHLLLSTWTGKASELEVQRTSWVLKAEILHWCSAQNVDNWYILLFFLSNSRLKRNFKRQVLLTEQLFLSFWFLLWHKPTVSSHPWKAEQEVIDPEFKLKHISVLILALSCIDWLYTLGTFSICLNFCKWS